MFPAKMQKKNGSGDPNILFADMFSDKNQTEEIRNGKNYSQIPFSGMENKPDNQDHKQQKLI